MVSERTMSRIWHCRRKSVIGEDLVADVLGCRKGNSVWKRNIKPEDHQSVLNIVLAHKRNILRELAKKENQKSKFDDALMQESIGLRRNILKPSLTSENIVERVRFALSFVGHVPKNGFVLDTMCSMVQIDQKGFSLKRKRKKFFSSWRADTKAFHENQTILFKHSFSLCSCRTTVWIPPRLLL